MLFVHCLSSPERTSDSKAWSLPNLFARFRGLQRSFLSILKEAEQVFALQEQLPIIRLPLRSDIRQQGQPATPIMGNIPIYPQTQTYVILMRFEHTLQVGHFDSKSALIEWWEWPDGPDGGVTFDTYEAVADPVKFTSN